MFDPNFQNRDSDTHLEIDKSDLMNPQESSNWEKDLVESEIFTSSEALEVEPDLEQ